MQKLEMTVTEAKFNKVPGKRIFLQALNPQKLTSDYAEWMQDKDVLRYLTGRNHAYSTQELQDYVMKMNDSPLNYMFGIFLNEDNQHIGNIKIGSIDPTHRFADVGLLIGDKSQWGKGYATEAILLVTNFAFERLNLNKVTAGMVVTNVGSYKAFMKAGFKEAGRLSRHVLLDGQFMDQFILEKCR